MLFSIRRYLGYQKKNLEIFVFFFKNIKLWFKHLDVNFEYMRRTFFRIGKEVPVLFKIGFLVNYDILSVLLLLLFLKSVDIPYLRLVVVLWVAFSPSILIRYYKVSAPLVISYTRANRAYFRYLKKT